LTSEEAKKRLSEYDHNELPEKKRISPVGIFISQFRNYLILVLIGAAIISGFTGDNKLTATTGSEGEHPDKENCILHFLPPL